MTVLAFAGTKVVLLVANLRPVKDVLFLLDAVDAAWGDGHVYTLVIVGCVIHYAYAAKVHERVQESRGAIKMYPQQTRDVLLDMIKSADMVRPGWCAWRTDLNVVHQRPLSMNFRIAFCQVVNSSVNEGMCAALQEAIAIGTLACARRNPGNQYLLQAVFGEDAKELLFDTAEEFIDRVNALLPPLSADATDRATAVLANSDEPPSTKRTKIVSDCNVACELRNRLVSKGKTHIEELTRSERTKWATLLTIVQSSIKAAPTRSSDQTVDDNQNSTVPPP